MIVGRGLDGRWKVVGFLSAWHFPGVGVGVGNLNRMAEGNL